MTHKLWGVHLDEYAYYVNKLRQNVGLETGIWSHIVTSQKAHTKCKGPPYGTEWKHPPWKFSAYATARHRRLMQEKFFKNEIRENISQKFHNQWKIIRWVTLIYFKLKNPAEKQL